MLWKRSLDPPQIRPNDRIMSFTRFTRFLRLESPEALLESPTGERFASRPSGVFRCFASLRSGVNHKAKVLDFISRLPSTPRITA